MRIVGALLLCASLAGCGGSVEITRLENAVAGLRQAVARHPDMNVVSQALVEVRLARDHARSARRLSPGGDAAVTDLLQTGVTVLTVWAGSQMCSDMPPYACLQPVAAGTPAGTVALLEAVHAKAGAALDALD